MAYRIVVADSSPSTLKAAQLVFAEPEYRVYPFEDGAALLEAIDGIRPDAVIVSLSLPGRDGYDVARTIRSRREIGQVPIVGLKGMFESLDMDRTAPVEYDEILLKPFDSERLVGLVRDLIVRKTGPASLPEEPDWPPVGAPGEPDAGTRGGAPDRRDAAGATGPGPSVAAEDLKAWVKNEILGLEREIEKRVRASVVAEVEKRMGGADAEPKPEE